MATNAERQRAYKKRLAEDGLVQVHGWVTREQAGYVMQMLKRMSEDKDLRPVSVLNKRTHRFEPIER